MTTSALAQIPNASFENWTSHTGYDNPDGWSTIDSICVALTGTPTVTKGTPGYSGSYYLKLVSHTEPLAGVLPGVAVTGNINISGTSYSVSGGFPYTQRPSALNGLWQYMPMSGDAAHIGIFLSKWNAATSSRDTIAFLDKSYSGMVMSTAPFSVSLTSAYRSGSYPDTAMIILSSSGPTGAQDGSYLYVDSLSFSGHVSPAGVATVGGNAQQLQVFPNPASDYAYLTCTSTISESVTLSVTDLHGKNVLQQAVRVQAGTNTIPVNVSTLAHGVYFIKVTGTEGTETQKIVVE